MFCNCHKYVFIFVKIFLTLIFCLQVQGNVDALEKVSTRSPPPRMAVVAYLPNNLQKMYEFNMMLYGSWKYVESHQQIFFNQNPKPSINLIDLIVFFDQSFDEQIPVDCQIFRYHGKEATRHQLLQNDATLNSFVDKNNNKDASEFRLQLDQLKNTNHTKTRISEDEIMFRSACWRIPQSNNTFKDGFSSLDNLLPFLREGIDEMFEEYQYILNVDTDSILTPGLWTLNLNQVVLASGVQQECPADRKLLTLQAATKIGLEFPLGRPWTTFSIFGETNIILPFMFEVYRLSVFLMHDDLNEWNAKHEEQSHKQLQIAKDLVIYQAAKMLQIENKGRFRILDSLPCSRSHQKGTRSVLSISVKKDHKCRFDKSQFFNLLANLQTMTPGEKKDFLSHAKEEWNHEQASKLNLENYAKFIAYKYAAIHFSEIFKF
ncbi:uncharacterized protein [Clytia hemisphaerica]|uniref:DUF7164 domain-containing protein n=1 Tax=Clytia hemisphaerica TaxID=252671 RepID=A0A7M5XG41_9CNID